MAQDSKRFAHDEETDAKAVALPRNATRFADANSV
jgi:hypothetical protein